MKVLLTSFFCVFFSFFGVAQHINESYASRWADSVMNTLSEQEKIAQLMIIRSSSMDGNRRPVFFDEEVMQAIKTYNVGGLCLFQGGPVQHAVFLNKYQAMAKTPLMITIDAENGVGMRFDSVQGLPRQMMLGAVQDPTIIQQYGRVVGDQCVRSGIHVNFAPVVDVNNNPANPVINDRSFGEDKHKVALYGLMYMRGMQDVGVMGSAKHFPGHGDVSVDSHHDLPVINKSRKELDSLELYPFRMMIKGGIGSIMVAHLYIPSIDQAKNRATSLSNKNVTGLLRNELGFDGLTFTDALEMKGVSKFFGPGEAAVESLIAGNDLLCLPGDIPTTIKAIQDAIASGKYTRKELDQRVKKVLESKYMLGLGHYKPIDIEGITEDLNKDVPHMRKIVAENAITLLRDNAKEIFPLKQGKKVAYVGIGMNKDNAFAQKIREYYDAQIFCFDYTMDAGKIQPLLDLIKNRFDVVVIGMHNYSRFPARNFGISDAAWNLVERLQNQEKTISFVFGNPYIIKNFNAQAKTLIACYEDDPVTQEVAADVLMGKLTPKGKLPVTVSNEFTYGSGITSRHILASARPEEVGLNTSRLQVIDTIVHRAIKDKAIPGAVVLVVKDGKLAFQRAYGYTTFDSTEYVYNETIYDLASVTKIMATTVSVMKLYDEGKIGLDKVLGDYLPWTRGTDKEKLTIRDILLHQAGLVSWIPFYRETVVTGRIPQPDYSIYSRKPDDRYKLRVAENLYMRNDYVDTMYSRIIKSKLGKKGNYVYSDNDFIFLGLIVEAVSGKTLEEYVQETFYRPLNMKSTGFVPLNRFPSYMMAPTEDDKAFRMQLIRGDVHDPGAAMFGGIAGHAGLFSNAKDLAILGQVLLNGGEINGQRFFKEETVKLFTAYHNDTRRGLGFDKPEKDNATRRNPYPALSASPATFGHTGFTGIGMWMDPEENLGFIFLSNRVNAPDPNIFIRNNIRSQVQEAIYNARLTEEEEKELIFGHKAD